MAIKNSILSYEQLDLLKVDPGKSWAITTILVCNHSESNESYFSLHLIQSGDARGNANVVVSRLALPPGETFTFDSEKIVLEENDIISFVVNDENGSGNSDLSATISYLEV